jgi:hypothetical protein
MRRIYCDEVLATEPAQEAFRDLERWPKRKPSASCASSATRRTAIAAFWRIVSPSEGLKRWI